VPPRELAQCERSELLMLLSPQQLADVFVIECKRGGMSRELRDEFNRRYWLRQEEAADVGGPLSLCPVDVAAAR